MFYHFGSHPPPDLHPGIFLKYSSTLRDRNFSTIWLLSPERVIGFWWKFLSQMHSWTRKSLLYFGSNPDTESESRPYSPWRMYAVSDCSCCYCYCYCQLLMLSGARQTVHVSVRFSRSAGARIQSTGGADVRWRGPFRCSNTGPHRSRSTTHIETTHHASRLLASSGTSDNRQLLAQLAWIGHGKRNDVPGSYRRSLSA